MTNDEPDQQRRDADTAPAAEEPSESMAGRMHGDLAPDVAVAPEPPAEDEEDVRRMWEASDPDEGEAPTG